ncbi:thiamine ABC transporter substrate binding subunit [Paracoccaceae bacterium GXU_MW_L88]
MTTRMMLLMSALAVPAFAQEERLDVYVYDGFTADWGPGPLIEEAFEAECGCDLQFHPSGDGAAMLSRLQLEGDQAAADVVMGLDINQLEQARKTGLFAAPETEATPELLPVEWTDEMFIPFDWSYLAFIYDSTKIAAPPKSFEEMIAMDEDIKFVMQDPRSSVTGLGAMMWVKAAYGDDSARIWEGLAPHILTVTKGWTEAYGMFTDGEADMVLSYSTSPAYHIIADEDDTKKAAEFEEGHYLNIEVAAKTAAADAPDLAEDFLAFIQGPEVQAILPTGNWSYPVVMPEDGLPEAFETLIEPEKAFLLPPEEADALREEAIAEWRDILAR